MPISARHRFIPQQLCSWRSPYDKVRAPVLCPTSFILLFAHRDLFAVTDGRKTIRGDSEINEVAFCALCSLGTQCQVILVGSTLVAMPFDLDPDSRMYLLKLCRFLVVHLETIACGKYFLKPNDVSKRTF